MCQVQVTPGISASVICDRLLLELSSRSDQLRAKHLKILLSARFQVFYPTLNINGKLFVSIDQNGVSPPPLQGQLAACTMEKVKEESVSLGFSLETMVEPTVRYVNNDSALCITAL